jgi:hypothetical protein
MKIFAALWTGRHAFVMLVDRQHNGYLTSAVVAVVLVQWHRWSSWFSTSAMKKASAFKKTK